MLRGTRSMRPYYRNSRDTRKRKTHHGNRLWTWRSTNCEESQPDLIDVAPLTSVLRFRVRFKSFIEQYELRELHFHSLMRTKELEVQYHMARYEREKKNAEAESTKARHLQAQVQAFTKTETELRNQLNVYVDKFKQVGDLAQPRCGILTNSTAGGGHTE